MSSSWLIEDLIAEEIPAAAAFVAEVFARSLAPSLDDEGIESFRTFLEPGAMRARFARPLPRLLARDAGIIVGFLEFGSPEDLTLLFVAPDRQRQGIGTDLLNHAEQRYREAFPTADRLELAVSPLAVPWFTRAGFATTAPKEVRHGIRRVPMRKILNLADSNN